jgi:hypothetical protein
MKTCLVTTIKKIETAFADVPPPPKWQGIYTAEAWDDYRDPSPEERAKDFKMSWQMVTPEDINSCTTALSHLKPEGWHHFIPAYMRWSLQYHNDPKWRDSNAMGSALFSLRDKNSKSGSYDLSGYIEERHSRLDIAQMEAVMDFLQCYLQEEVDFYFDQLFADSHYWYERYKNKGGQLTKEAVLWLLYG